MTSFRPSANLHAVTGIAFGYISAHSLDSSVVSDLMDGTNVEEFTDHSALAFESEFRSGWARDNAAKVDSLIAQSASLPEGADADHNRIARMIEDIEAENPDTDDIPDSEWEAFYDCQDQPLVTGILEDVTYASSWLGGALHFFILESPHVTQSAGLASICVPNAGILDSTGSVEAYDVPADWRAQD